MQTCTYVQHQLPCNLSMKKCFHGVVRISYQDGDCLKTFGICYSFATVKDTLESTLARSHNFSWEGVGMPSNPLHVPQTHTLSLIWIIPCPQGKLFSVYPYMCTSRSSLLAASRYFSLSSSNVCCCSLKSSFSASSCSHSCHKRLSFCKQWSSEWRVIVARNRIEFMHMQYKEFSSSGYFLNLQLTPKQPPLDK